MNSNRKFVTISDYYMQDVPEGTHYIAVYPSSVQRGNSSEYFPVNRTKWLRSVPTKEEPTTEHTVGTAHNKVSFLGKGLKALVSPAPDDRILKHWGKVYGQEAVPEFGSWGTDNFSVVQFPLEELPAQLHSVDPDAHYKVHSKRFIGEINVPQAKILNGFQAPCCVKVTHGQNGKCVYFVHNREEYDKAFKELNAKESHPGIVVTELVQNVKKTISTHYYVNKKGETQWISAAEQYLQGLRSHGKGEYVYKCHEQKEFKKMLYPIVKQIGAALHNAGYFGYVGSDIVIDGDDKPYVVDINPRVNGSTALHLSTPYMRETKGHTVGIARENVHIPDVSSLDELLANVENVNDGTAVVTCAFPKDFGFDCDITVYSSSEEKCNEIYDRLAKLS